MPDDDPRHAPASRWALGWLALAMVLVGFVRWRLLDVPLERDEGEYAHAGALLLDGVPPYSQARNMKLPGIYAAYALVMAAFGETQRGIHLGLLVVNLATMLFVFRLGQRLLDAWVGVVAAGVFGSLSLVQAVQGPFANAEHFVLLLALPGLLLVLKSCDERALRWLVPAGLLLGCGLVVKQHGALLTAFGGVVAALGVRPWRARALLARAGIYAAAAALPYLVTCLLLWLAGVFETFWFWTVDYALTYVSRVPLDAVPGLLRQGAAPLVAAGPLAFALAATGLAAALRFAPARRHRAFPAGFALFSFLAVCPGFYFRDHYFVLLLPAAAVLAGLGARALGDLARGPDRARARLAVALTLALGGASIAHVLFAGRAYLFQSTPDEVSRTTYGLNPFPESPVVAEFLARHTDPDDTIAVIGSEPQIYFYARRRPAHPFLYTYPLVEPQPYNLEMQRELIRAVEASRPRALVFVQVQTSWLTDPDAPKELFHWLGRFTAGYELAQVVEIREDGTRYHEGAAIARLRSQPNPGLYVYLRR